MNESEALFMFDKDVVSSGGVERMFLCLVGACLLTFGAPAQANPHAVFSGLLNTVSNARIGGPAESGDDSSARACDTTAEACYLSDVEPVVQQSCVVCHQEGLTADQQGARLLFTNDASSNHSAMEAFVTTEGVGADWLLDKIVGDRGHGGGPVLTRGGADYLVFADYLTLLVGANTDDGIVDASAIWSGTTMDSRETTLRRAAILLAGKVPENATLTRVKASDKALKLELESLLSGDGFHDFLVTAANDRLLTHGLNNGIDWDFDFDRRFPSFSAFRLTLPEDNFDIVLTDEYKEKPFLEENSAIEELRWAAIREPVELIAFIAENDRSYKEVVTADFTMVNQFSAIAYRADMDFEHPISDDNGFYNRKNLTLFKPAKNVGHIPFTDEYGPPPPFNGESSEYTANEYHEWPHSGVLAMPAWLGRYPSTATNRNRARARWTYYHFLGVDIEKTAPRSTDPVALADTNNPTMNNPACTVCHERMDPVAGAYQSFGDEGHYLDSHGGVNSLPRDYTSFGRPDGEPYHLEHSNSTVSGAYVVHEISQTFSTRGTGGNFAIRAMEMPCNEEEVSSNQDSWCSRLFVLNVAIYADGAKFLEMKASDFESHPGFSVHEINPGDSFPIAHLEFDPEGEAVYMLKNADGWGLSFNLDLPEGEYEVRVNLATQIADGHPESTVYVTAGLLWSEGFYSDDNQFRGGDTWYRDMRSPGFNGKAHTSGEDSIQWLGQQIANDPRFAKATVKFWWPAVFGAEALVAPTDRSLPEYEGQLLAFNAQEALVEELAAAFTSDGYKLKSLLADMVLSPWFRTSRVDQELSDTQQKALATVGRGRLLTPEELDRKNRAIFGRTWGENWKEVGWNYEKQTNFTSAWSGYATFYGGHDSASIVKRNRENTAVMANVTERMAAELACQIVLEEFSRPQAERMVFTSVEKTTSPEAKEVAKQLDAMYLRATGNTPSNDMKRSLLQGFENYADATVAENGGKIDGQCADDEVWDSSLMTDEDRQGLKSDSVGSLRAWTLMVHALMTSYSYLHD